MTLRGHVSSLAVLLTLGCLDATAPAWQVNGTWADGFTVPGNGFQMTLSTQGSVVSGDGQWSGEACCAGPVSVTGVVADGVVKLDMTFVDVEGAHVPTFTEHFEGRVVRFNTLSGALTLRGQSTPHTYQKMH